MTYRSYKSNLLPYIQKLASKSDHEIVYRMREYTYKPYKVDFFKIPKYQGKDTDIKYNGYKIVKKAFSEHKLYKLEKLAALAEYYDCHMKEFADKDEIFMRDVNDILCDQELINLYEKVYGNPFLWQKTTIHRKKQTDNLCIPNVHRSTAEHIDLTETPNGYYTLTGYIPLVNQNSNLDSRIVIYENSHNDDLLVPITDFEYFNKDFTFNQINMCLIADLNHRVNILQTESWIRDAFYYLLVMQNTPKIDILKSTLLLFAYNPQIKQYKEKIISLNKGDMLFFAGNVIHAATKQINPESNRVALAVRGNIPYYEESSLITHCVSSQMYKKLGEDLDRDCFLFSGTSNMLKFFEPSNIIYKIKSNMFY